MKFELGRLLSTKNEDRSYWHEEANSICKITLFKQNHPIGPYICSAILVSITY